MTGLKTTVRVENVPPSLTADSLHPHFITFGEIIGIDLAPPPSRGTGDRGGRGRGGDAEKMIQLRDSGLHGGLRVAHVEFEDPADAAAAVDNMHLAQLLHHPLTCSLADPRSQSQAFEGLGSNVPLWQQEGFIQQYLRPSGEQGHADDGGGGGGGGGDPMAGVEQQRGLGANGEGAGPPGYQPKALPVAVGPLASGT